MLEALLNTRLEGLKSPLKTMLLSLFGVLGIQLFDFFVRNARRSEKHLQELSLLACDERPDVHPQQKSVRLSNIF